MEKAATMLVQAEGRKVDRVAALVKGRRTAMVVILGASPKGTSQVGARLVVVEVEIEAEVLTRIEEVPRWVLEEEPG